MTFADELRSSKGPQLTKEEIAGRQYRLNFHIKAVLEELKRLARSQNNAGKHSVSGYLAYAGYDKDYWRLLPTMRNTLREFLKLSRPLHSVSVVAKQAPLALSNAKVSCKHGLWLVARVNKITGRL